MNTMMERESEVIGYKFIMTRYLKDMCIMKEREHIPKIVGLIF